MKQYLKQFGEDGVGLFVNRRRYVLFFFSSIAYYDENFTFRDDAK